MHKWYFLIAAILFLFLSFMWSKKSALDAFLKVILFIMGIGGLLFFLEAMGYSFKK
jgi:hypothetical protein